jgi:hypothetical protein
MSFPISCVVTCCALLSPVEVAIIASEVVSNACLGRRALDLRRNKPGSNFVFEESCTQCIMESFVQRF